MWTILLNFDSTENLTAWQQSSQRAAVLAELAPLTIGGNIGEVMQPESPDAGAEYFSRLTAAGAREVTLERARAISAGSPVDSR